MVRNLFEICTKVRSFLSLSSVNLLSTRFIYNVEHNTKSRIFYIKLNSDATAVLYYKIDGKVMDLRSVVVPKKYGGRGIARVLTEAAFTYAITNDYYLFLTCSYTQKYYLVHGSKDLKERVIGPKEALGSSNMDLDSFEKLRDPEK